MGLELVHVVLLQPDGRHPHHTHPSTNAHPTSQSNATPGEAEHLNQAHNSGLVSRAIVLPVKQA
jgi:hypothetical protein